MKLTIMFIAILFMIFLFILKSLGKISMETQLLGSVGALVLQNVIYQIIKPKKRVN